MGRHERRSLVPLGESLNRLWGGRSPRALRVWGRRHRATSSHGYSAVPAPRLRSKRRRVRSRLAASPVLPARAAGRGALARDASRAGPAAVERAAAVVRRRLGGLCRAVTPTPVARPEPPRLRARDREVEIAVGPGLARRPRPSHFALKSWATVLVSPALGARCPQRSTACRQPSIGGGSVASGRPHLPQTGQDKPLHHARDGSALGCSGFRAARRRRRDPNRPPAWAARSWGEASLQWGSQDAAFRLPSFSALPLRAGESAR